MKIKSLLILLFVALQITGFAQDTLQLFRLRSEAEAHYPNLAKTEALENIHQQQMLLLKRNFYPQIDVGARATWQSDVTTLNIEPGTASVPFSVEDLFVIPDVSRENYKVTMDVSQVIWDGGATGKARSLQDADLDAQIQAVKVEAYQVGETVNGIFFNLLLLKAQNEILAVTAQELQSQYTAMLSGINNGVIPAFNAHVLEAEMLRLEQKQEETQVQVQSLFNMLNILTGKEYRSDAVVEIPTVEVPALAFQNMRPELSLFQLNIDKLSAAQEVKRSALMPKIAAFGQAGYGMPGLNLFSTEFSPWVLVGAQVTWKPWDWNKNNKEREILNLQKELLKSDRNTFDRNISLAAEKTQSDINRYQRMLLKDNEIIALHTKIKEATAQQVTQGTITSTEYVTELSKEKQALLNKQIHEIQLLRSRIDKMQTTGTIINNQRP